MKKLNLLILLTFLLFSCEELPEMGIEGCIDNFACNYNPDAAVDDKSCIYPTSGFNCDNEKLGCIDTLGCNYDQTAEADTGSCIYPDPGLNCDGEKLGCTDPIACNYDENAEANDGSCVYPPPGQNCDGLLLGCTDPNYLEYYTQGYVADIDDGSCQTIAVFGCMDPVFCNFNPQANLDDGSCSGTPGCTDPNYCNYDVEADCDDGSCFGLFGCTDPLAQNYNSSASCDDGSCTYSSQSLLDGGLTPLQILGGSYGLVVDDLYGCTYQGGLIFYFDVSLNKGLVISIDSLGNHYTAPGSPVPSWVTYFGYPNTGTNNSFGTFVDVFQGKYNTNLMQLNTNVGSLTNPGIDGSGTLYYMFTSMVTTHNSGGYNDWFIPSINELINVYNNLVFTGKVYYGDFQHVSSSEFGGLQFYTLQMGPNNGSGHLPGQYYQKGNFGYSYIGPFKIFPVREF